MKRKVSVERPPTNPFNPSLQILKINSPSGYDKTNPSYLPFPQTSKNLL
jgi:hypothetical protein